MPKLVRGPINAIWNTWRKRNSKAKPSLTCDLCRSHIKDGKRFARFNPLSQADRELFQSVLAGEFALNGFCNRDLCPRLYPHPAASSDEAKRRCTRVSRLIAKLRGHGLVAKVKDAHLYRITKLGSQVLSAVLMLYHSDFPTAFLNA